jgi:hypothetical protein
MAIECDAGGRIHLSPGMPFTDKELRNELGISRVSTMNRLLSELISLNLLSKDAKGLFLNSFSERNYLSDNSAARVQKHRQKGNTGEDRMGDSQPQCNGDVTPPEQSRAEHIKTEHIKTEQNKKSFSPQTPRGGSEKLYPEMAPINPTCPECQGAGMVDIQKGGVVLSRFCSCRKPREDKDDG